MSKKRIAAVMAFLGLWALVIFVLAGSVLAQGPALPPGEYDLEEGQYVFNVPPLAGTETAPAATSTAVPTTATAIPTATPEPSGHNDRVWHPLNEADTYEHKANPHDLDDIFGTDFYTLAGGEISYPWQTPNENLNKHEGYGWLVERGTSITGDKYISDYRVQYHAIVSAFGSAVRFHSIAVEARLCDEQTGICGNFRGGGHLDYGNLFIDGVLAPLPGDNPDANNPTSGFGTRLHNTDSFEIWYSGDTLRESPTMHSLLFVNLFFSDPFGPLNVNDPTELTFYCPDFQCGSNNSKVRLHHMQINLTDPALDLDGDGTVDIDGYTDRYGNLIGGCSVPSVDCVPLLVEGLPVGVYRMTEAAGLVIDGDTSPPGEFWIRHPN